jgi:LAO/AO transport system kinase
LIEAARDGNIRALAQLISWVENRREGWKDAMKGIYVTTGHACVVGITGSPGAGKSTLTNEIAKRLVLRGHSIGIIAVDPSSPFSGGALLGDRLRMNDICTDERIFIRSMATRGMLGGLCQAARDVARILDAAGKDIILIETVGVGQDEIEVVSASDFVVLVTFPGQGDGIQAIKAGVMEIADLFVVNKADRDGADVLASEISAMLELSSDSGLKAQPVIKTSAVTKEGLDELVEVFLSLLREKKSGPKRSKDHVRQEILSIMEREVSTLLREQVMGNGHLDAEVDRIVSGLNDPYTVVDEILSRFPVLMDRIGVQEEKP